MVIFGLALSAFSSPQYQVCAWGWDRFGECDVPADLTNAAQVAVGGNTSLALRSDGTVAAWGENDYGECNVPSWLSNVTQVAGGASDGLALRADGTVVSWGENWFGQTNVPAGLSNVVQVAGGEYCCMALRSDGTVAAWGWNNSGQLGIASAVNVKAIAAGIFCFAALKSDGTVTAYGSSQGDLEGLNNVVAIAVGDTNVVALKSDGTTVIWDGSTYFSGPSGVKGIAGLANASAFLKTDGTVEVDGPGEFGTADVPPGLTNVVAIAANASGHILALAPVQNFATAAPIATTLAPDIGESNVFMTGSVSPNLLPTAAWFEWGTSTNYGNATEAQSVGSASGPQGIFAAIDGLQPLTTFNYRVVASNALGVVDGANVSCETLMPSNYVASVQIDNGSLRLVSGASAPSRPPPSVWASADFVNWTNIGTATALQPGLFQYYDSNVTNANLPRRFYRLSWP